MPPHPNHTFTTQNDLHAAFIAMASVLKVIAEKLDVNPERVRQMVESAAEDDDALVAGAQFHIDWILGHVNSDGDRG